MKELEKIKIFANGMTLPEVKSGSFVFLIQDGTVQVGKLYLGDSYDFISEIEHPKNQKELGLIAFQMIKEKKPEYLKSERSIITLCPTNISEKMIW